MDFGDFLTGILVLIAGGILGGIGTYLVKPPLDAWLKKRKERQEAREAARKKEEEAAGRSTWHNVRDLEIAATKLARDEPGSPPDEWDE